MLFGALGALLYHSGNKLFFNLTTSIVTQILCWLVILAVAVNKFHLISFLDNEFIAAVTVCLIMGQVTKKNRIINLDNGFCDFLGKISYGIYVIHPLIQFIFYTSLGKFKNPTTINYIFIYVAVTSVTIFAAWLSYEYFEKRFLKMRARFSTVKSSGTKTYT